MNLHEMEELEYRFGPKLWDAGEGVCCAAYQLGGDCCAPAYEPTEAELAEDRAAYERALAEDPAFAAEMAAIEARMAERAAWLASNEDEPF